MKFDPEKHHRRSIRLNEYDYTQPGWYFITIVVQNRLPLLGKIANGKIILSTAGEITKKNWLKIPQLRSNIELDNYTIMPNHIHGIINIIDKPPSVRATESVAPTESLLKPNSLGSILGQFKSATTKEIKKSGILQFKWQRNYWERVIRDEAELNRIRKYIIENPLKWQEDSNFKEG